MRYIVSKMFKVCPITKEVEPTVVTLSRTGGQMRKLQGNIGGSNHEGHHVTELRGTGPLMIEMEPGTTFAIQPAE